MPSAPADQQARDAAADQTAGPRARTKAAGETDHGERAQSGWQTSVRRRRAGASARPQPWGGSAGAPASSPLAHRRSLGPPVRAVWCCMLSASTAHACPARGRRIKSALCGRVAARSAFADSGPPPTRTVQQLWGGRRWTRTRPRTRPCCRCRFGLPCHVVKELDGRGHCLVPPQRQRVLDSGGRVRPVSQRHSERAELVALFAEQVPRIGPGPFQQRKLDQQLRPDIPAVPNRRAQPLPRGCLASRGRSDQRTGRSLACVFLPCHLY
jgi:hypothetical protein